MFHKKFRIPRYTYIIYHKQEHIILPRTFFLILYKMENLLQSSEILMVIAAIFGNCLIIVSIFLYKYKYINRHKLSPAFIARRPTFLFIYMIYCVVTTICMNGFTILHITNPDFLLIYVDLSRTWLYIGTFTALIIRMWLLYFDINVSRKIELKLLSNSLHLKPHKGIKYIPSTASKVYTYKASSLLSTSSSMTDRSITPRPTLKSIKSDSNNNNNIKSDIKMYSRFSKSSSCTHPSFSTKMETQQERLQKQISMLFSNGRQARFYSVPRPITYCYLFMAVAGILFISMLIPLCMVEYDTNGHSKVK